MLAYFEKENPTSDWRQQRAELIQRYEAQFRRRPRK